MQDGLASKDQDQIKTFRDEKEETKEFIES